MSGHNFTIAEETDKFIDDDIMDIGEIYMQLK